MDIASASKLIFGAYVVERYKDNLSQANAQAMRMGSGYVSFDYTACMNLENGNPSTTVDDCFIATHGLTANNHYSPIDVGHFYYNGGHFQFYADDNSLNLGDKTNATLADEMKNQLGQGLNIAYSSPQLAGGAHLTPGDYAQFLQKIVSGGLAIRDHLGEDPVCTNKDTCDTAIYSPAYPHSWHYSWGHWVEDDPTNGDDGAFSSPGAFGFYPWIDASKKYYGILARRESVLDAVLENASPYKDSAMCGRLIRKAFLTGVEQ